jgi:putative ABC transport system permease protein
MLNDLRLAGRRLVRTPGLTAIATLTLALGIGAATGIYAVYDAVLLKPLPYDGPGRIVSISVRDARGGSFGLAGGTLEAVQALPAMEHAAALVGADKTLLGAGDPEVIRATLVTPAFFEILSVQPLLGRLLDARDATANVVVLSHRLWLRRFGGDAALVGRAVRLDSTLYTVAGVLPPAVRFPEEADAWLPYQLTAADRSRIGPGPFLAVGQLRKGSGPRLASLRIPAAGEDGTLAFEPLLEFLGGPYRQALGLLLSAVAVLLIVACLNVANLLLARGAARQRELEVCRALGASRWRMIRPVLLEAALLAFWATAVGLYLASAVSSILPRIGEDLPRVEDIAMDWRVFTFAAAASALSIAVAGLVPACLGTRGQAFGPGHHGSATATRPNRVGRLFLGAQVAASVIMCVAAALVLMSLHRLTRVDLGFDAQHLTVTRLRLSTSTVREPAGQQLYVRVLDQLRSQPDVESAAAISQVPLERVLARAVAVASDGVLLADGRGGPKMRIVTPGAFRTLGVPLVRGRDFTAADDAGAQRVAMVNETLAEKLWGTRHGLDHDVTVAGGPAEGPYRVVGIVADFRPTVRRMPQPELYVAAAQNPRPLTLMVRSPLPPETVAARVRTIVASDAPEIPVTDVSTVSGLAWTANAYVRRQAVLLAACAAVATLFTLAGILTMTLYAIALRAREIGIRIAVGASPRQVVAGELWGLLPPLAGGLTAGVPCAYVLTRVLQQQALLFDVSRFEPALYATVAVVFGGLLVASAWLPARRAARVDPLIALRAE